MLTLLMACAMSGEGYFRAQRNAYCDTLDRCGEYVEGATKDDCLAVLDDDRDYDAECPDVDEALARECIDWIASVECDGVADGYLEGEPPTECVQSDICDGAE